MTANYNAMSRQDRIQHIQQQKEAFVNTPALRPIASPMTPITPLELGESPEKDVFVMHAAKQYHNSELHKQTPEYFFTSHYYHNNGNDYMQQQSSSHYIAPGAANYSLTQSPHSPSPFSSGASTPTLAHVGGNSSSRPKSCPSSPILNGVAYNGSMMMMTGSLNDYYYQFGFDSRANSTMFQDLIVSNVHHHQFQQQQQQLQNNQYQSSYFGGIGGSFAAGQYNNIRVIPSLYDQLEIAKSKNRENTEQAQLQDLMSGLSQMDIKDSS
ncbi:2804_t:CDS:2 [Ambispora gerdemannii]|uniref:2804_t:CDS:1 n=1 Tax=Ambispora gerdemannii TaxID=144530 RepID=A0A9N9BW53_9GLOM|nr:2804_t:CDS:2 [Ambispora gerdemannii]